MVFRYVLLLLVCLLLIGCSFKDRSYDKAIMELCNKKPKVTYYRLAKRQKGKDFYNFSYMYRLSIDEAKYFNRYYKVRFDRCNRVNLHELYLYNKLDMGLGFFYIDSRLHKIKSYNSKGEIEVLEYKYVGSRESELTHYNKDGLIKGKRLKYYKGGLISIEETYKGGSKVSERIFSYNKGGSYSIKSYIRHELDRVSYIKDNLLIKEDFYDNEVITKSIVYDYNGRHRVVKERYYIANKLLNSIHYKYNTNGYIVQLGYYKFNKPHGKWVTFNFKGSPVVVKLYNMGKLLVKKKLYYTNGRLRREEDWVNNKPAIYYNYTYNSKGYSKKVDKFNQDNKLLESEVYQYKVNKPFSRKFYKAGNLILELRYKDGLWVPTKRFSRYFTSINKGLKR